MKAKRQSTVEPIFGTLTQFMGLRKINTVGVEQANKIMKMSAIAYNLKKYLKFISNTIETDAKGSATFVRLAKTGFKTSCKVTKRSMIAYQTHHKQWLKSPLKEIFEPLFVFFGDCATVTVVSRYFYFLSWNAFETS